MKKFITYLFVASLALSVSADLIISEVTDPADHPGGRYVQIFNGSGGTTIDLAAGNYYLSSQYRGGTWSDTQLTGTIGPRDVYVVARSEPLFISFYGYGANQYSVDIDGQGRDCYLLYVGGNHTNGTLYDAYGVIDQDGLGQPWYYRDTMATRTNTVITPNTTWTAGEWTIPASANVSDMDPANHDAVPEPVLFGLIALSLLFFFKK